MVLRVMLICHTLLPDICNRRAKVDSMNNEI